MIEIITITIERIIRKHTIDADAFFVKTDALLEIDIIICIHPIEQNKELFS